MSEGRSGESRLRVRHGGNTVSMGKGTEAKARMEMDWSGIAELQATASKVARIWG